MMQAPETGYTNEIVFTPEDWYRRGWFYCRIGNNYGRGYIERIDPRDEAKTIETKVTLYMQPNGSRNLETGEKPYHCSVSILVICQ